MAARTRRALPHRGKPRNHLAVSSESSRTVIFRFDSAGELVHVQREHLDNVPGHDGSSLTEQPSSDSPEPEPQSLTAAPPDVHAASSVPPSSASDTSTAFSAASHSTASSDATENEPAHSVEAVLLSDLPTSDELSSLKVDEVRHYAQSIGLKNTKSRPKFELLRIIEDARRGKDPNSVDTSDMVPDMPSTARELRSFNLRELRAWAKHRKIPYSKKSKNELVEALLATMK